MKIKLLDPNLELKVDGVIMKGGGVYEVDANTAARLIESNYAVEVEETHENKND